MDFVQCRYILTPTHTLIVTGRERITVSYEKVKRDSIEIVKQKITEVIEEGSNYTDDPRD